MLRLELDYKTIKNTST